MRTAHIKNIQGLISYVTENSAWQTATIHHVITALGYRSNGSLESLKSLSANLTDCAKHGADGGFPGFTYYCDTLSFFRRNKQDIVKNLELLAEKLGEDIIGMVQHFGVFRHGRPPSASDIGRALWGTGKLKDDLTSLYNEYDREHGIMFGFFILNGDLQNAEFGYIDLAQILTIPVMNIDYHFEEQSVEANGTNLQNAGFRKQPERYAQVR
jgi:hypothetical protein